MTKHISGPSTKLNCGCIAWLVEDKWNKVVTFKYCQLHEAAPDLFKVAVLSEETSHHYQDCGCKACVWLEFERKAIIQKAKGES